MPFRRRMGRRYRRARRRVKRYAGTGRQAGYVKRPVDTFAQRKFVQMNYTLSTAGSAAAAALLGVAFRANDITRPVISLTERPYSYNEWRQFYRKFRVHGVKIYVTAAIRDADANAIMFIGTASRSSEIPDVSEAYMDPNYRYWSFSTSKPITRSRYFSIAGIEGKGKQLIKTNSNFSADFDSGSTFPAGTSPANLARVIVGFANANLQSGVSINIDFRTQIKFYCELSEPRVLPSSNAT